MKLQFGLTAAIPEEVSTAWGARLIEPADLVHDRQDIRGDDADELLAWSNGSAGNGALHAAREHLRVARRRKARTSTRCSRMPAGSWSEARTGATGTCTAGWLKS